MSEKEVFYSVSYTNLYVISHALFLLPFFYYTPPSYIASGLTLEDLAQHEHGYQRYIVRAFVIMYVTLSMLSLAVFHRTLTSRPIKTLANKVLIYCHLFSRTLELISLACYGAVTPFENKILHRQIVTHLIRSNLLFMIVMLIIVRLYFYRTPSGRISFYLKLLIFSISAVLHFAKDLCQEGDWECGYRSLSSAFVLPCLACYHATEILDVGSRRIVVRKNVDVYDDNVMIARKGMAEIAARSMLGVYES